MEGWGRGSGVARRLDKKNQRKEVEYTMRLTCDGFVYRWAPSSSVVLLSLGVLWCFLKAKILKRCVLLL